MTDNSTMDNASDSAEEVITTSQALTSLIDEWDASIKSLKGHLSSLRAFRKEVVSLEKELAKRNKSKKRRNNGENKKPSGFAVPTAISDDLADFLGLERGVEVARTEVTKRLNTFIKENDLKNPENKREIVLDGAAGKKLSGLLSPLKDEDGNDVALSFFNIQRYIKHHFPKSKANMASAKAASAAADTPEEKPVAKKIKKKIVKKSRAQEVAA